MVSFQAQRLQQEEELRAQKNRGGLGRHLAVAVTPGWFLKVLLLSFWSIVVLP